MLDDEVENYFDKKRDVDLENKIIAAVGLMNEVPYKMRTEIKMPMDSKIIFRESTENREGSAEHIVKNHKNELENDINSYLDYIKKAIQNPERVSIQKNGRISLTIIRKESKRDDISFLFNVILEKNIDGHYEIVTAHRKTEKMRKKKS